MSILRLERFTNFWINRRAVSNDRFSFKRGAGEMSYVIRLEEKENRFYFWGIRRAWTFYPEEVKFMDYINAHLLCFFMRNSGIKCKVILQELFSTLILISREKGKLKEVQGK